MGVLPVHIAVLTIADDAATADRATARAIGEKVLAAGHEIVDEEIAKDNESAIRDQLVRWIAEDNIDVIIVAAGVESEAASAALAPLIHQTLPGFTDLFRWLTFQEIGASAMLSAAEAAQCQSTFVFVLPAHEGAVRAAMDKLILPQLDVATMPKNLVTQMPRVKVQAKAMFDAAKSQPVGRPAPALVPDPPVVPASPPEAVPTPIAAEKTAGGSGVEPKLPARSKSRTANTISRKLDDPPTKPIDVARLEKQIALSTQNDAQTKQVDLKAHDAKTKVVDMSAHQAQTRVVDSGRVLPRMPPGADATALDDLEDEALTFRAPTTPRAKQPSGPIPSVTGRATPPAAHAPATPGTSPGTPAPTSRGSSSARTDRTLTTPSFSTPVRRTTPVAPYRAVTPPMTSRSTVATPPATPIVTARQPVTPRANATPPASPREEVLTPETPVIALRQPPRSSASPPTTAKPPTTPPPTKSATTPPPIAASETPTQRADREAEAQAAEAPATADVPTRPTPPPNAAELWAQSITPASPASPYAAPAPAAAAIEEIEPALLEPDEDEPSAVDQAPATDDEPSPLSTLFANQPPRTRVPTAPPPHLDALARTIPQGSLPEGEFSYPSIKRSGAGLLLKLLIAAAVIAAGFFAFVQLYPADEKPTRTAAVEPPPVVEPPPPPAPVAEVPADAQAAVPPPDPAPAPPPVAEVEPPVADPKPTAKPVSGSTKPATRPPDEARPPAEAKPVKPTKPSTEIAEKPAAKPVDPDAKPEPANPDCDEVSCVMTKYDRPCCERFKPSDGFTPRNVIPDNLDKPMVKAGVETVKPRVVACGEKNGAKGTVRVTVAVAPEGNVKSVSVIEAPDTALGECVAAAMRKARFGKSANGGEFNYPFVF